MDNSEYSNIFNSEEKHFYYKSVHHLILNLVDKFSPAQAKLEILDAGCGTGGLAMQLASKGNVSAVDLHPKAVEYATSRGLKVVQSSIKEMPFPSEHFDVVTCVDVIYHQNVDDDVAALKEISRVLKPNGVLVMRVPARPELFSSHDLLVWTKRRYTRRHLRRSLHLAGLKIKRLSYCHGSLYLPALIKAKLDKATSSKEHSAVEGTSELVNRVAEKVLKLESQVILNGIDLPIGLGIIAVAGRQ